MRKSSQIKIFLLLFMVVFILSILMGCQNNNLSNKKNWSNKTLVVYFSEGGNTKILADYIIEYGNFDYYRIETKEAYPSSKTNYQELANKAKEQLDNGIRSELKNLVSQEYISSYDNILLGHPVWWYDLPMPVWTFLETYDFEGSNIYNFFTHAGSSLGASSGSTIELLAKNAIVHLDKRLSIVGSSALSSRSKAESWVDSLNL